MKKLLLPIIVLHLLLTNCNKKVANNTPYGLLVLNAPQTQNCFYVYPANDGALLALYNSQPSNLNNDGDLYLKKIKINAGIEWEKKIEHAGNDPKVNSLKDGGIIIISNNSPNRLIKFDNAGNLVFNKEFGDTLDYGYNTPVEGEDGNIYTSLFKPAPWFSDTNGIIRFDKNGNHINGDITIQESLLLGTLYSFNIYRKKDPDIYYFYGYIYPFPVDFGSNAHLFVSRFEYTPSKLIRKTVVLDAPNLNNINSGESKFLLTPNNELLILNNQQEASRIYKGHLSKVSEDMKLLWEIDFRVGIGNTFPNSIVLCNDGNYLIAGDCSANGKALRHPYAIKIDQNGKILWTWIYEMPGNSNFESGFQATDGTYYFGGTTNGFGNGLEQNDVFVLRKEEIK